MVRSLYTKLDKPPLHILLSWHPNAPSLKKADIRATAEGVTNLILNSIPDEDESSAIDDSRVLPGALLGIVMFRKQGAESTSIGNIRSTGDMIISLDEIRTILRAKEERLLAYRAQECTEIWLLIVAEGAAPSSLAALDPSAIRTPFDSGFDRGYFYDALNGVIKRLNLRRAQ